MLRDTYQTLALIIIVTFGTKVVASEVADQPAGQEEPRKEKAATKRGELIEGANRISLRAGIDPALGFTLGYGREFPLARTARNWLLFGELSSPFASIGQSGDFTSGARIPIVRAGYFRFSTEATLELGWTTNRNYNSFRIAPGLTLLAGVGKPDGRWFVDGVFGYERAIANYLAPTDFYRTRFYEDAKSGWYQGSGGSFRMGLRTGFRVNRWEFELRAAHDRTERFNSTFGSPFYATLGASVRF